MKKSLKKIVLCAAAFVVGAAAFAEVDLSVYSTVLPFSNLVTNEESILASGIAAGIDVQPIFDNGLTLKFDLAYQQFRGDTLFAVDEDNKNGGQGISMTAGVGTAFVQNEKWHCTLTGLVGLLFLTEENSYDVELYGDTYEFNLVNEMWAFRTGLDLTAVYRVSNILGLYANAGLYYNVGSYKSILDAHGTDGLDTDDSKTISGFTFAPSIGATLILGKD